MDDTRHASNRHLYISNVIRIISRRGEKPRKRKALDETSFSGNARSRPECVCKIPFEIFKVNEEEHVEAERFAVAFALSLSRAVTIDISRELHAHARRFCRRGGSDVRRPRTVMIVYGFDRVSGIPIERS